MRIIRWLLIGVRILVICFALYMLALIFWPEVLGFQLGISEEDTVTYMSYDPDEGETQLMILDENLPHRDYQRMSDSIKYIQALEKSANYISMDGWVLGFMGYHKRKEKKTVFYDSLYRKHTIQRIPDTTYFISLDGFFLKIDHSTFRKNDTTFLRYPVITKRDTINKRIEGHYEIKPLMIDVQDPSEKTNNAYEEKRELFIRVSKSQYTWYLIMMIPIAVILLLLFLWGVILQTIRILEDIANQDAFRKKTYRRLYIITICLWCSVLIRIVIPYLLKFYFDEYIDNAFYLRFTNFLSEGTAYILFGFITFCLAHAFRKGYQLQQDQNLTI